MIHIPSCPKCTSEYAYENDGKFTCPECSYEWNENNTSEITKTVKDAHGNLLQNGDSVALIKDLKVKGSSAVIKAGTKVKNIQLVDEDHDIDCKIDGFGKMGLKSEFVKKI
jgi:protein PhnA